MPFKTAAQCLETTADFWNWKTKSIKISTNCFFEEAEDEEAEN